MGMPSSFGAAVRAWTLIAFFLGAGIARASVWNNPLGGSWNDATNWDSIPNGVGAIADFSKLDLSADATVTLDGAKTVGSILFGDTTPSSNWNLNTGTAGGLALSATVAGTANITVADQTTVTFNTAITNAQ